MSRLGASTHRARLRGLWLFDNPLGDAVGELTEAGAWPELRKLHVGALGMTVQGLNRLAEADLPALEWLVLNDNRFTGRWWRVLGRARWLDHLSDLLIGQTGIGDDFLAALARWRWQPRLRSLKLSHNPIGPAGAASLSRWGGLANLKRLELSACPLGDEGAGALAQSPHLDGIEELYLNGSQLTDAGARALAAGSWPRLGCLAVFHNPLTEAGLTLLRSRFGAGVVVC